MIIIKIIGTVVAMSILFMWWAFPIQVCALVLYYFIIKKRLGRFLNPYVRHDMLVPIITVVTWSVVGLFSHGGKSLANILELFWLGGIWAMIICIRFLLICITKKKSRLVCLWGNGLVFGLSILFAYFFPSLAE